MFFLLLPVSEKEKANQDGQDKRAKNYDNCDHSRAFIAMIIWTVRVVRIVHMVRVWIWLVRELTLVVQVWCITIEELVVLFVQYVIIWVAQTDADPQPLVQNEVIIVEARHVVESVVLLQEENACIRGGRVLRICIFKDSEVASVFFAEDQTIDEEVGDIEKEFLVLAIMRHHLES